ncbi:uncharacterized protein LOC118755194 [Rhagoletis pomonella]|uniref:uncharacterized protein LOC118755194 n=1 Tax=Rhagoletis pomonella TaxID=28610 RepID=UPI0017827884|nr:uncharacterized protein LOC118755194 [Rhagoletis pomonella]
MTQPEATTLQKLVDNASAIRGSLLSIGSAEEIMNNIMIHILLSKVDAQTKAKYNEQQGFDKLSSWEDCCNTLNRRCQYLESQGDHQSDQRGAKPKVKQASTSKTFVTTNANCVYCNSPSHYISSCNKFKELSLQQRIDYVRKAGICFNCLRKTHCMKECQSKSRCKICQSVHHTLLHNFTQGANLRMPVSTAPSKVQDSNNAMPQSSALLVSRTIKKGIIPTAIVQIRDKFGQLHLVRALLDSCSEISFITEETAKLLQLEKRRVQQEVSGIAGIRQKISHNVFATLRSRCSEFEWSSTFSVIKKICANQPQETIDTSEWCLPPGITLADPQFYLSTKVDILINTMGFFEAMREGKYNLGPNMPCLLNSAYGWIVGGSIGSVDISKAQQCNVVQEASSLEQLVKKFWEVEDCITKPAKFTDEEQMCEEHFVNTVRVQKDGRLQVRLPFKTMPNALGNSFDNASKRFKMLERRFGRDEQLKNLYSEFMNEYISLGHMSLAQNVNLMKPHFYIPHHCILRPQSLTTKLRVVFDASAKTTSGQSLNELLMVGPTIQQD